VKIESSLSAESLWLPLLVWMTSTCASRRRVSTTLLSGPGELKVRRIVRQIVVASTMNSWSTTRSSQPPVPIPTEDVLTTKSAESRSAAPPSALLCLSASTTTGTMWSRDRTTMPHQSWPERTGIRTIPALNTNLWRTT